MARLIEAVRLPNIDEACVGSLTTKSSSLDQLGECKYLLGTPALRSEATLLWNDDAICLSPCEQAVLEHSSEDFASDGQQSDGAVLQ